MIYLIDDTPSEFLEGYISLSEYGDVIKKIDAIKPEEVYLLSSADCILVHSSFNNQVVKRDIMKLTDYGEQIPLVLFSDGDRPEAEFDGDQYITSIKKSVMYSRLEKFILTFQSSKVINLNILAGRQVDVQTSQLNNVFSDFLRGCTFDFANNSEGEVNSLKGLFCVGREGMNNIARSNNGKYVKLSLQDLKIDSGKITDKQIHDFVIKSFIEEVSTLVLDLDADPEVYFAIALHVRLTKTLPGKTYLCPIVFVSDLDLERLLKKGFYSQILMTDNIYFCNRKDIANHLSHDVLDENDYTPLFLDKICIPAPKGSNHSLANQWGASRLYGIINGANANIDFSQFNDVNKELYYKYMMSKISRKKEIISAVASNNKIKGSHGKRVLLIDDEANKGWEKTIESLFPMSFIDVISESVLEYDDFSYDAKDKIENEQYDIYLLDLRLGGIREDCIVETERMSGYKILKKIKQINRGNQVIILTASNKAWNHKALTQNEWKADGYFVKESPEYEFPDEFSIANLLSLKSDVELCLKRGYLKKFWHFKETLKKSEDDLIKEIYAQLFIAYDMASNADSDNKFNYAFIALYQVLEIISSKYTIEVVEEKKKTLYIIDDNDKLNICNEIVPVKEYPILYKLSPYSIHSTSGDHSSFSQREKISAIYLKKWGLKDDGLLYLIGQLITIRNAIIHIDSSIRFDSASKIKDIKADKYLGNSSLIYQNSDIQNLLLECARKDLLLTDSKGNYLIMKGVANDELGLRILLWCLTQIIQIIAK